MTCPEVPGRLETILLLVGQTSTNIGWSTGFPFTQEKQRKLLTKIVATFSLPTFILVAISMFYIADASLAIRLAVGDNNVVRIAAGLDRMVYALQQERDKSVIFMSKTSPQTRSYLYETYRTTDSILTSIPWPDNLDKNNRPEYKTKVAFQMYMANHRNTRTVVANTMFQEIIFYATIIKTLMLWLNSALGESKTSEMWKQLVAYENVIACQEIASIERTLGVYYFSNGGFDNIEQYIWFTVQVNTFDVKYKTAQEYSDIVPPFSKSDILSDGEDLGLIIQGYRNEIIHRKLTESSLEKAYDWLDKTSLYLNHLRDIQNQVEKDVTRGLDALAFREVIPILGGLCTLIIMSMVYPLMINNIRTAIRQINDYTEAMLHECDILNEEKQRSDTLLCKMLPSSVAEQITKGQICTIQDFKHVTILFSDIVQFDDLVVSLPSLQLITFLDEVFRQFDSCMDRYNVYKVETIADVCMITSGLPEPNKKHATEISNLALELVNRVREAEIEAGMKRPLQLRIGINSGRAMAGVVGTEGLQYCVFGDDVNIASRMATHGLSNSIHISSTTQRLLWKCGRYVTRPRGLISVKGKGKMATHLLLARKDCIGNVEVAVPLDEEERETIMSAAVDTNSGSILNTFMQSLDVQPQDNKDVISIEEDDDDDEDDDEDDDGNHDHDNDNDGDHDDDDEDGDNYGLKKMDRYYKKKIREAGLKMSSSTIPSFQSFGN